MHSEFFRIADCILMHLEYLEIMIYINAFTIFRISEFISMYSQYLEFLNLYPYIQKI